jgi:hypothetical protein
VTLSKCHRFYKVICPAGLISGPDAECGASSYDNNSGGVKMNAITGWGTLTVFFVFSPFIVMSMLILFSGKPAE